MRKILFSTILLFSAFTISAQGFYVTVGVGYNHPLTTTAYQDEIVTTTRSTDFNGVNLGKGIQPAVGIGYMFTKNVGFDLKAGYSLGTDNVVTAIATPASGVVTTSKQTFHSRMLALYPSIKLAMPLGESNTTIYSRTGLAIPVMGSTKAKQVVTAVAGSTTTTPVDAELNIKGKPTLGMEGGIGFEFAINESMALFTEVNGRSLKVWAKNSEVTKYNANGTNALPGMNTYQKETNFVETVGPNSNNSAYNASYSTDKPKDELRGREANFTNIGVALGLVFKF